MARRKKPKQGHLDGMEPPSIKALDDAADNYYEAMMDRVKLSKEEDEAKTNLIEKMKEHGLDRYETASGYVVSIVNMSKVKVKPVKNQEEESDGSDDSDNDAE